MRSRPRDEAVNVISVADSDGHGMLINQVSSDIQTLAYFALIT
jgi:hypothetical protein